MMWIIASVPFWASGLLCVRGAIRCIHNRDRSSLAVYTATAGIFFAGAALVAS